ncbi:uncharacterized protein LOC122796430 [Protopterus annectens]|uniref:uncharacterized protein LOC122796430 n=1 Tax=Protopterus annectens TaxID=7888 RepID=UPI001CFA8E97|nr:uncharacterized protein LOC122796430 [Protopterus annectens]
MAQLSFWGITLLIVFASEVWSQAVPFSELVTADCFSNLFRIRVKNSFIGSGVLTVAVIDQLGKTVNVTPSIASQCGYTTSYDFWGNFEFRASVFSCSSVTDDGNASFAVQLQLSGGNIDASTYLVEKTCTLPKWAPREMLCEANYMEVSVRHSLPPILNRPLQDSPEDWETIITDVAAAEFSLWQIVFIRSDKTKRMLVTDAISSGYGMNNTKSRLVLRSSYGANETEIVMIDGLPVSAVRSSTFFKQPWMVTLIDTAVVCPVDGLTFTHEKITWESPRILSRAVSSAVFSDSKILMGVELQILSSETIARRNYSFTVNETTVVVVIPFGAEGGTYKSHVFNGQYVVTYSIELFLEHVWKDNLWEETRHVIVNPVTTPLMLRSAAIINNTIPDTKIFNVTVGPFLGDVQLINITVGTQILTIDDARLNGYSIDFEKYPNGSIAFVLKVPFDKDGIDVEYETEDIRLYTLNITLGLSVLPWNETFAEVVVVVAAVRDAVLPTATGYCDNYYLYLSVTRGNVDQNWLVFIGNMQVTPDTMTDSEYFWNDNGTHFTVGVSRYSSYVNHEGIDQHGLGSRIVLTMRHKTTLKIMVTFSVSCRFDAKDLIDCFPNGTVKATVMKMSGILNTDASKLALLDESCSPLESNGSAAVFIFNVNACGTARKFTSNTVRYENEVLFFPPGMAEPSYRINITCDYPVSEMLFVGYGFEENPAPAVEPGNGSLALIMRLSKDASFSKFYAENEYPVTEYLGSSLYFEVELLYSEDPQLELFLEDCWASTSPSRTSNPQWDVIVGSCENTGDSQKTVFHPVTANARIKFPSHLKRFEVKMFAFAQEENVLLENVFFHCSVVICDARLETPDTLCARSCIPRKQRGRRSAQNYHLHGYVTSGAVIKPYVQK